MNDQANYLGEGVMVDDLVPIALDNGVLTIIRPATASFNETAVFYEVKSAAKKFGSELIAVEWLDATPIELHLAKTLRRQGL